MSQQPVFRASLLLGFAFCVWNCVSWCITLQGRSFWRIFQVRLLRKSASPGWLLIALRYTLSVQGISKPRQWLGRITNYQIPHRHHPTWAHCLRQPSVGRMHVWQTHSDTIRIFGKAWAWGLIDGRSRLPHQVRPHDAGLLSHYTPLQAVEGNTWHMRTFLRPKPWRIFKFMWNAP